MEGHIRTTAAANVLIANRSQLSDLLDVSPELIAEINRAPNSFYSELTIAKSNGQLRTIRPPRPKLRSIQRRLLGELYDRVIVHSCLHGGIRKKSTRTHAIPHVNRRMVATLDIRSFFPSTTCQHLEAVFAEIGFRGEAVDDLLSLVSIDNQLPQGAPTSSFLANLAFARGDGRFIRLCKKRKLRYSRYVDDIAISGEYDFPELRGPFVEIIESHNYSIADEKIHFMPHCTRQVVTGLIVNKKLRPTRQYITELKHNIRLCIEHGAAFVASIEGIRVRQLKDRLTGQVNFIRHVDRMVGDKLRGCLYGVDWHSNKRSTKSLA